MNLIYTKKALKAPLSGSVKYCDLFNTQDLMQAYGGSVYAVMLPDVEVPSLALFPHYYSN